jgi:hypothetical protein
MPALTESAERAKNDAIAKAQAARAAFNQIRTEVTASDVDLGPGSDAAAKLDEAHTALCAADEAAEQAKAWYIKAVQMDGGSVPPHAEMHASPQRKAPMGPNAILEGEEYQEIRAKLVQSGKLGVGGVKPLGEAWDRNTFRNALVRSSRPTASSTSTFPVDPLRCSTGSRSVRPTAISWSTCA